MTKPINIPKLSGPSIFDEWCNNNTFFSPGLFTRIRHNEFKTIGKRFSNIGHAHLDQMKEIIKKHELNFFDKGFCLLVWGLHLAYAVISTGLSLIWRLVPTILASITDDMMGFMLFEPLKAEPICRSLEF